MRFTEIITEARKLARPFVPSEACSAATVGSVIISGLGNRYTGVCVDFECGIGFCAEHAAVAEMMKRHESKIAMVVAVDIGLSGYRNRRSAGCSELLKT